MSEALAELYLADPISPHSPNGNGLPGSQAIDTIISWTMYGALIACVIAIIVAGGMVALGNTSALPHLAERGKVTLIWSVLGAMFVGLAIPLVNKSFGLT